MHYSAEHNSIQQVGVWTNQVESIKDLNFRLQNPQKSELEFCSPLVWKLPPNFNNKTCSPQKEAS